VVITFKYNPPQLCPEELWGRVRNRTWFAKLQF